MLCNTRTEILFDRASLRPQRWTQALDQERQEASDEHEASKSNQEPEQCPTCLDGQHSTADQTQYDTEQHANTTRAVRAIALDGIVKPV
jgi:hypothetical protein